MTQQTNFLDSLDPAPPHTQRLHPSQGKTGEQARRLARRDDPASSQEAAAAGVASGTVSDHAAKILALLKLRPATSRELAAIALKYTSRVSDLRQAGHHIECRKCVDHETHKMTHIYILVEADA